LMVGDRADTDLDGAHRLGWATALVLSGVARPADLPDLAVAPDHLLADVGGLLDPPSPAIRPAGLRRAAGTEGPAGLDGGTLVAVDGERVVGTVAWHRLDGGLVLLEGPAVEEGWRGRLLGTRLVVAACVQARAAGARRVAADARAEGFLERLGFRRSGPDGRLLRDLPAGGGDQR
ncbi:MAG TPA: GNAT family N-acetyltransferase, partial [Actinomycetota bacterium]|nr:GNAT family N-acetyltransferase [Actinomycetota bacterium]